MKTQYKKRQKAKKERLKPTTLLIEMDGALLNSLPVLFKVYKELLEHHGYELSKLEFREVFGLPPQAAIPILCEKCGIKKSSALLQNEFFSLIGKYYTSDIPLAEGALDFLENVKTYAPGLELILLTSTPLILTQAYLEAHEMKDLFDEIIWLDQWDFEAYNNFCLYALDKLHVQPEESITVAFSDHAINAAFDAGMLTIKLTHKGHVEINFEEEHYFRAKSWDTILRFFYAWR